MVRGREDAPTPSARARRRPPPRGARRRRGPGLDRGGTEDPVGVPRLPPQLERLGPPAADLPRRLGDRRDDGHRWRARAAPRRGPRVERPDALRDPERWGRAACVRGRRRRLGGEPGRRVLALRPTVRRRGHDGEPEGPQRDRRVDTGRLAARLAPGRARRALGLQRPADGRRPDVTRRASRRSPA